MQIFKNFLFLFFCILSLVINAPPPTPEKMYETVKDVPKLVTPSKLDASDPSMEIQNSTLITNIYDDYRIEEHQLIIVATNLPKSSYYQSWGFTLKNNKNYEDIKVTCKILDSTESCIASKEITKDSEYNSYKFSFQFKLFNDEQLIIEQSHKLKKTTKDILYKTESITIPVLSQSKYCDYKYTIPDGYKFLGFKDNLLKKESDKLFTYKGECPKKSKSDVIRFSPRQSMWKADTISYLKSSSTKFKNSIKIKFPRYYRGGKNINSNYTILSTEGKEFNEEEIIFNYTYLSVEIPAANTTKLGVELHTVFTNKLSNKFDVFFPKSFYEIDEKNLNAEIKAKAEQIINNKTYYPRYPNYYKLGRFVNSYMTYDLSYSGKEYTPKEIYDRKHGVCEHYTILYNEMLNSIGIKTLFVFGWGFQNNETSGNKDTTGHSWTVALIDGKWIELDSTWGLFEGISAGHILKGFFKSGTSYSWSEKTKASLEEIPNIVMIPDDSESKDQPNENNPAKPNDDTTSTSTENSSDGTTESDKNSENKEEENDDDNIDKIRRYGKSISNKLFLISFIFILLV